MVAIQTVAVKDGKRGVMVWDRFVRVFHWSLVAGFSACFLSGEFDVMWLHVWVGYALVGLVLTRIVWGFRRTGEARFANFAYGPADVIRYLRSMVGPVREHYIGHNPAGACMVFMLLALVSGILVSGLLTLGTIDFEGPLMFFAVKVDDATAYLFQDIHELLPKVTLVFIAAHVAGVLFSSVSHEETLISSMISGVKQFPNDDTPLVSRDMKRNAP